MKKQLKPIISSTIVTYNRLDYTKATVSELLKTRQVPGELIVVDNNSDDGTQEWLIQQYLDGRIDKVILNARNMYPGYARNQGWDRAHPDVLFLHSSDNDMVHIEGWDLEAMELLEAMPELGQVGIMNQMQHLPKDKEHTKLEVYEENGKKINRHWWNIGGTCVVRVGLFKNEKVRWDEQIWTNEISEDAVYSHLIKAKGYFVGNVIPDLCRHMSLGEYGKYLDYSIKSFEDRQCGHILKDRLDGESRGKYRSGKRIVL